MLKVYIGVGTPNRRGHGEPWPPHFSAKIIFKIFPFFLKHNFYTENASPGRGLKHKSAWKFIVEGLVFARDEIEVSLAPSLWVTFLRP